MSVLGDVDLGWLESLAAAAAALFAAVSAWQSSRATKVLEKEIETARRSGEFDLVATFEREYRDQYDGIVAAFGPWPGSAGDSIDLQKRKVVHSMLSSLMSIYIAQQSDLLDGAKFDFSAALFAEWLQQPEARQIWVKEFRWQEAAWPTGFVEYVDDWLARPSPWDAVRSSLGSSSS